MKPPRLPTWRPALGSVRRRQWQTQKANGTIVGGRGRLRRSLYAAALPATFRWNKALVGLYARLTASCEAHNVALIACARKLLIYANTVVQRGTP